MNERAAELAEILAEVRRIEVQSRKLVAEVTAGGWASVFKGAGIEFAEVREYEPGDDPRAVDWSVTARLGRPFVKRFAEERERTVLFVLDLSASMDGGFAAWSMRHTAARACACLALSAVRAGDKVSVIAFRDAVAEYVEPAKGQGRVLRLVRDCLLLPAGGSRTDLAEALRFARTVQRRHAVLFVVSDFLATGWEAPLAACARRHDAIAVRLLAPELELPRAGLVRVVDPETGETTVADFGDERVRAEYAARVAAWRARTDAALAAANVDCIDLPLPRTPDMDAVAGPIVRFFRAREQGRARR